MGKGNRIARKYYDGYSRLSQKPKHINDIWLIKCPFDQNGGYYKIRPCLVTGYNEENIIVIPITSQKKLNEKIETIPPMKKDSYVTKIEREIKEEYFVRKIGRKMGTQQKGAYIKDYHKHGRK